ncbi:hypothetical protein BDW62DRAFT_200840 [Aspergillus aurantiobrunneus]
MGSSQSKPPRPPTVPTDSIIPMSHWDQGYFGHYIIDVVYRFDDVLDAAKLRESLETLMTIRNWRMLGARLRQNQDSGQFEYHLPAEYSAKRPPFIFNTTSHNTSIHEHPIASQLPRETGYASPAVLNNRFSINPLFDGLCNPTSIDAWLTADLPQVIYHVVVFRDATLLKLTHNHGFMDGMSRASLLNAWMTVLHGKEDEVPELCPLSEDARAPLAEKTTESEFDNGTQQVGKGGMLRFLVRTVLERLWYPEEEDRLVCIPGHLIAEMTNQAVQTLSPQLAKNENETSSPFISESDVLFAFWSKILLQALQPSASQQVMLSNAFDIRSHSFPRDRAYMTNAMLLANTVLPAKEVLASPVSTLALLLRRSLEQQRTAPQIGGYYALSKRVFAETGRPIFLGRPSALNIVVSNWHRGRCFDLDFSPAVYKAGTPLANRANALGKPSLVLGSGVEQDVSMRNVGVVMGKDAGGNWWMSFTLRKKAWVKIEKMFSKINVTGDC